MPHRGHRLCRMQEDPIRNVLSSLAPVREKRLKLEGEMDKVRQIITEGDARARREAVITMEMVRKDIGILDA